MEPTIRDLPEMTFAGLETRFISIESKDADNHVKIPPLWDRFVKVAGSIPERVPGGEWGLCYALPERVAKAHPDELLYMAAAQVKSARNVPPSLTVKTVPAGRYAVFTHRGSIARIGVTMGFIHGEWLPKSGRTAREAPELELYDERFKGAADDSEMDIYVPIE